MLAGARGVLPDGRGSDCAVCGRSPYAHGRASSVMFGDNFSDFEALELPGEAMVCEGCVSILCGRPGDDPPPLRMQHVLAVEGEEAVYPPIAELEAILVAPPDRPFVVTWSASRKKHAALRAEVSVAGRIVVGTDDGPVVYERARHLDMHDAVRELRVGFSVDEIVSGKYGSAKVAKYGAARWSALEQRVSAYRPSAVLAMVAALVRKPEAVSASEELPVIDPHDMQAANILASLSAGSKVRQADALRYWSGFLAHRVERRKYLALPQFVSRMMTDLQVSASLPSTGRVLEELRAMSEDTQRQIETSLRERAALITALAFTAHKAMSKKGTDE